MPTLPPLADLLAFDAAARHGTFTRAAGELNVSQPAISRRVAALEDDLGVLLFDRRTKPMRLTAEGEMLFDVLRSGLSRLEATLLVIRNRRSEKGLTIAAGPGFLSFWLIPRLPKLAAAFPEIKLRIMTGDDAELLSSADVLIHFGDGAVPGTKSLRLLGEAVYPVCSPAYLGGKSVPMSLAEITEAQLLQLEHRGERWYDWSSWIQAAGAVGAPVPRVTAFDSYALLIGAALAGQGIALCWAGLLDRYLESGALVRVSDLMVTSNRGYHATCAPDHADDSVVFRVMRWLASA